MTKLKKISVLLVLAIFLISLMPAVLAAPKEEIKPLGKAIEKAVTTLENAKGKVEKAELPEEIKPLEKAIEKTANTLENAKEKVEKAKERYQQAKERYQEVKQKYLGVKARVNELRTEIQGCLEGECEPKRKQFRIQSRDVLIHLSDVVLETLNKLKSKIESSEMIEEEKEQLLADLEVQMTEVEEAKAVLEGLTEEVTKEEIKEAIKTIKEAWRTTKPQIKLSVGKLIGAKLGNVIVKTEQLEEKFTKIRDRLEGKGYDVSALDNYLDALNEKLASAKENWNLSREMFREARTAEDVSAAVKEAHQYQKKARELIKEARKDLRDIVREIKGLEMVEETEETEEEAEEEAEEAEEEEEPEEAEEEEEEPEEEETEE